MTFCEKLEIANINEEVETMLVLSRKMGESIQIGTNVMITIHKLSKTRVSLTIDAPEDIKILRSELIFDAEIQGRMGFSPPFVDKT